LSVAPQPSAVSDSSEVFFDFGKKARIKKIALIAGGIAIFILAAIIVIVLLKPKPVIKNTDIVVGDITITQADIDRYVKDIEGYKAANPSAVLDDPERTAVEDLVSNAALKTYNKDRCNVEVTAADVLTAGGKTYEGNAEDVINGELGSSGTFIRTRAENMAYKDKMDDCMIDRRKVFRVGINFDTAYFFSLDEATALREFENAKQKLRDEYLPLFEQGMSSSEIAKRADVDYYNPGGQGAGNIEVFNTGMVVTAGAITCTGAYNGCFSEKEVEYVANPGEQFRVWDKISALQNVGDYTDIFASTAGAFIIGRVDGRSGGEFVDWDDFLKKMMEQYAYTRLSMVLNTISTTVGGVIDNIATTIGFSLVQDAAAFSQLNDFRRTVAQGAPARCAGHDFRLNLAVRDSTGTALKDWEFRVQMGSANECTTPFNQTFYDPSYVQIWMNCNGDQPKYGENGATGSTKPTLAKEPPTHAGQEYEVFHRFANNEDSEMPDLLPWTPQWINEASPEGAGIIIKYQASAAAGFDSRSYVKAQIVGGTSVSGLSDWDSKKDTTLAVPESMTGEVTVNVSFYHDMRRNDAGTNKAKATWTVAPSATGATAIAAMPASKEEELQGGQEKKVSTTNPVGVPISAPTASVGGQDSTVGLVSIPVTLAASTTTVKLCQKIGYKGVEFDKEGGESEACVTITRNPEEEEMCTAPDGEQYPVDDERCDPDTEEGEPGSPPTAPKSAKVFSSYIRAMAMKDGSVDKQAEDACSTGDGTPRTYSGNQGLGKSGCASKDTTAPTSFVRPQHKISYAYTGMLVALNNETTDDSATDQAGNWRNFPAFSLAHTLCGSENESSDGKNCAVKTPANGQLTLSAVTGLVMPPLNLKNKCTLNGPNGLSGSASPECSGENDINTSVQEFRVNGEGHAVGNADLGKKDVKQTMEIQNIVSKKFMNCHAGSISDYVADCTQDESYKYEYTYDKEVECEDEDDEGPCYEEDEDSYAEVRYHWVKNVEPSASIKSTAQFNIPYNYTITPQLVILPANAERIQIGGTDLSFSGSLKIGTRANAEVGETYATATRHGTRWAYVEFYVRSDRTSDPNGGMNLQPSNAGASPCSFYQYDNGIANTPYGCNATEGSGSLNQQSGTNAYNLFNGSSFDMGFTTRTIADAPIGTKYCVSVAVMDRDSTHNNGYDEAMGGLWSLTQPECVSIGKMPTTNVLGDGLYSDGKIEGAVFDKTPHGESDFGAFGSFGEYEVVSNNTVKTFASGAALGMGAGGVGGSPLFGGAGAPVGAMLPRNSIAGSCQIAPLTFANIGCSTMSHEPALGQLEYEAGKSLYGRATDIKYRYMGRDDARTVSGSISPNSYNTCANAQVVSTNAAGTACAHYVKANGTLTINAGTLQPGRSLIVESSGTVVIGGDIALGNGPYADISQIPQVMIFAPNIQIEPSVKQVDAWLLAGLDSGTGTINTCRGTSGVAELDGRKCTNPLRVSGPVIASRVLLHRTAGADPGMPGSARSAEVFYLSPATYLWAYNQSANLSQAFLTYAREVAPRF
jgi:hypothetical protein